MIRSANVAKAVVQAALVEALKSCVRLLFTLPIAYMELIS